MLAWLQQVTRWILEPVNRLLRVGFLPDSLNPLRHLGSLTIFFFWIVLVSGIWLFIFFRTSVDGAYQSVEYLTHSQWYLGGVMRSLHRYASDAAIITLALHIIVEFAFDRHRGKRWFSWLTGMPLVWMVIPLGITGYWLVWDELALYVAITSAELIDWLPIFTDFMARNFLTDEAFSDRFFTLMAFLHLIGLPLFLVLGIWLHVFRINGPRINPPRSLMAGSLLAMLALSLVFPALSQGQAQLDRVPESLGLDWFYLTVYPLMKSWSPGWVWGLLVGISLLISAAPWLPPRRPSRPAVVDLDNCNGCERCVVDCPFGAVAMQARTDGKDYATEAVVDPDLCLSCGICVGSCPTATPFRTRSELIPGIDLPDHSMAELRASIRDKAALLSGDQRRMVFVCEGNQAAVEKADSQTAVIELVCLGQLPPAFMDFVLSRDLADQIVLAGCGGNECQYRLGENWTQERIARERDPRLRKRVDESRITLGWLPEPPSSTNQPPSSRKSGFARLSGTHLSFQALAYILFAVVVGALSVWPRVQIIEPQQAVISLSFSHAGQRLEECRTRTQEELNALPPNMRKPTDCPRERHPVDVVFSVDGQVAWQATLQPSGIWSDGESTVYRRITLDSGEHEFFIGMRDSGRKEGFDFEMHKVLTIEPGQHVVTEFDNVEQQFRFR
jgi:ferredoxin